MQVVPNQSSLVRRQQHAMTLENSLLSVNRNQDLQSSAAEYLNDDVFSVFKRAFNEIID